MLESYAKLLFCQMIVIVTVLSNLFCSVSLSLNETLKSNHYTRISQEKVHFLNNHLISFTVLDGIKQSSYTRFYLYIYI